MERKILKTCEQLKAHIDCPIETSREAIRVAAKIINANHGLPVPVRDLRREIDGLLPGRGDSNSLYRHLVSNSFLVEVVSHGLQQGEPELFVRFPFERFSEYLIAEQLTTGFKDVSALKRTWKRNGTFKLLNDPFSQWENRGLYAALAILIPELVKVELPALLTEPRVKRAAIEAFRDSLAWRTARSSRPT
jgi:hypothetical protein